MSAASTLNATALNDVFAAWSTLEDPSYFNGYTIVAEMRSLFFGDLHEDIAKKLPAAIQHTLCRHNFENRDFMFVKQVNTKLFGNAVTLRCSDKVASFLLALEDGAFLVTHDGVYAGTTVAERSRIKALRNSEFKTDINACGPWHKLAFPKQTSPTKLCDVPLTKRVWARLGSNTRPRSARDRSTLKQITETLEEGSVVTEVTCLECGDRSSQFTFSLDALVAKANDMNCREHWDVELSVVTVSLGCP